MHLGRDRPAPLRVRGKNNAIGVAVIEACNLQ
jgi:hypothetical protein